METRKIMNNDIPNISKTKILAVFVFFIFVSIIPASNATALERTALLSLSIDKTSYFDKDFLYIDIVVDSEQAINTIFSNISFSTSSLSLLTAEINQSICSFSIGENINNQKGSYAMSCLTPLGAAGRNSVAHLTFKKNKSGFTTIKFNEDSMVLAHDGQGSDILGSREIHNIYLVK